MLYVIKLIDQWLPTFSNRGPFILKTFHGPSLKVLLNRNFPLFCDLLTTSQKKGILSKNAIFSVFSGGLHNALYTATFCTLSHDFRQ